MESGCARLHIVSTGNGDDDAFAALYGNAVAGRGAYKTLFISSDADPRRDLEWYRVNVEEAADPDSARREHARSPLDAFRSPEGAYFKRFRFERHVKEIEIVPNSETFRAIDFGYRHPGVAQTELAEPILPTREELTGCCDRQCASHATAIGATNLEGERRARSRPHTQKRRPGAEPLPAIRRPGRRRRPLL